MALSPSHAQKMTEAGQKVESALKRLRDSSPLQSMAGDSQNNIGDHNVILNNPTINYNTSHPSTSGEASQHVPALAESQLAFIMENCLGQTVDVKVKVCDILEPAGRKQRSKPQFRGSFRVADETSHTTLKVFGPHRSDVIALLRPNQDLILREVKVNSGFLNFTSYSKATKCTKSINVPAATRHQMRQDEANDLMTLEQILMIEGHAKTEVFVEKVGMLEERFSRKKRRKGGWNSDKKIPMRSLTVKEKDVQMKHFTLMLMGDIAKQCFMERSSYIFSKVKYNREFQNFVTVENCSVAPCPPG